MSDPHPVDRGAGGTRPRWWRSRAAAYLALAAGMVASFVATLFVSVTLREREARRFRTQADTAVEQLRQRMLAYETTIGSAAALFEASDEVTRDEFRRFVSAVEIERRFPGMQGLGFARWLDGTDRGARARVEGALRPYALPGQDFADRRSAVVYIEPLDHRNLAALGYDMFAEPVRRRAMERARDTGAPAVSNHVELVQEIAPEKQPGFLLYVPVYAPSRPQGTVEERRAALIGWSYAPFRAGDFATAVFGAEGAPLDVEIYDGNSVDPGDLLYDGVPPVRGVGGGVGLRTLRRIDVAGETWTIAFHAPNGLLHTGERAQTAMVAAGSLVLALLLFGITWTQVRGRELAEEANERILRTEAERRRLLEAERAARAEAERAERRAAFLADATTVLASELASPDLLERVARLAVPFVGDSCAIDLAQEDGTLRREVLVYRDPELEKRFREMFAEMRLDDSVAPSIWSTFRSGVPLLVSEFPKQLFEERLPAELLEPARRYLQSFMVVPLATRDRVLGTMGFGSETPGRFSEQDLAVAIDLGRRVAVALDNARLFAGAQEAIRVRDDFLSIASHELRTPLTVLSAQLQGLDRLLRPAGPVDLEQVRDKVGKSLRQTRRLAKLVTELLDVARIAAGRMHLERERFDLAELARELVDRLAEQAVRARSELRLAVEGDTVGSWDHDRLEQVVTNLLANALKYGGGAPIDVSVRGAGERVELAVRDRGIGIPEEAQARIFGRFERAASERHYGGLGLGLYISRQIVAAHGGGISVRSAPGRGSTFEVILPREPPRDAYVNR